MPRYACSATNAPIPGTADTLSKGSPTTTSLCSAKKDAICLRLQAMKVGKRFAKASAHYLLKQERWEKSLGDFQALPWSFDQEDGLLVFEMPDGSLRRFEAEVLGSYLDRAKEWEWAWNNPNVSPQMSKKASELREYGRQHNVPFLVEGAVRAAG